MLARYLGFSCSRLQLVWTMITIIILIINCLWWCSGGGNTMNGHEPKQLWLDSVPSELFREIHISIHDKFVQSPKKQQFFCHLRRWRRLFTDPWITDASNIFVVSCRKNLKREKKRCWHRDRSSERADVCSADQFKDSLTSDRTRRGRGARKQRRWRKEGLEGGRGS